MATRTQTQRSLAEQAGPLTPLELHALAQGGKAATKCRDALEVGQHEVDLTVRIRGTLQVGAPQTQPCSEKPKADVLLGLVLSELPPRELVRVTERVQEALAEFVAGGELPAVAETAQHLAEALIESVTHRTTRPVRGNVTSLLAVERVT